MLYPAELRAHNCVMTRFARQRSIQRSMWRRERDSNPRWAFDPYTLSRGAPSTTRPSLRCETSPHGLSRTCGARYSALLCSAPLGPTESTPIRLFKFAPANLSTTRPSLRCETSGASLSQATQGCPYPRRPGRILAEGREVKTWGEKNRGGAGPKPQSGE